MSFFILFLIGILIGTAMIIPGVSGAVIAVIFGVYDKMILSLNNLFKDFKKNFFFLAVLGTGIFVGAIWFSNVLMFLYKKHEVITKFVFVGLILGGVPFLLKELNKKKEKINFLAMIISFSLSFILWILSKEFLEINLYVSNNSLILNTLNLFIAGVIYSIGKVIPGVSSSFLLILMGMYEYVLLVMAHPITVGLKEIEKLIPFIFGLIVGVITLLKIINFLLKRYFGLTYSIIIGFVIGSIPALMPNLCFSLNTIIGVIFMLFGFMLSYELTKY